MRTLSVMCEKFKYAKKLRFKYGPSRITRDLRLVPVYSTRGHGHNHENERLC